MKSYSLLFQLIISIILEDKNRTIKQFHLYREKIANNLLTNLSKDYIIYKYIFNIKKQKLATISYASNT